MLCYQVLMEAMPMSVMTLFEEPLWAPCPMLGLHMKLISSRWDPTVMVFCGLTLFGVSSWSSISSIFSVVAS